MKGDKIEPAQTYVICTVHNTTGHFAAYFHSRGEAPEVKDCAFQCFLVDGRASLIV